MLKTLNYIFYIVFISLMLGVAGLLVGSMLPIPGNIELKIVKSGSMEPTIPTGSLVVVKPASNYSLGDVITFGADTRTEIPTTHRIISLEADTDGRSVYRTQGDANEDPDANPVQRSEVIGKVAFHLPYVGFILDFARQPLGFALLVGIPAALVIMEEVLTIAREVKKAVKRRRRKEEGEEDEDEPRGGTRLKEVSQTERMVYLRKRAMDEIFVPMVVRTHAWMHVKVPKPPKDAYASATAVVLGIVFVSSMLTGGSKSTIAYFNDIERSILNTFAAADCDDFILGSCDLPEETVAPESLSAARTVFLADAPTEEEETEEETEEDLVEGEVLGTSDEQEEDEPEEQEELKENAEEEPTVEETETEEIPRGDEADSPAQEPEETGTDEAQTQEENDDPAAENPEPDPAPAPEEESAE